MELNRYTRSYLNSETVRFTLQIEKFSTHARKGYYLGPEFQSGASGSRWSLVVYIHDGADYGNFIEVRLKRECYLTERQYVNAKLSIVDRFGINVFASDTGLFFHGNEDRQVLSVTVERMSWYFGMNKLLFLPNDSLRLQCELLESRDNVLRFNSKRDYEHNIEESGSVGRHQSVEYFTHTRMMSESFSFTRRIDDFTTHISRGSYVCPDYHRKTSDSKWTLILYANDDYRGSFVDVRLKCSENDRLAKVKLSVVDPGGRVLVSSEKEIYFTASKEAQILSVRQNTFLTWIGFKNPLPPDDAMTFICEVDLLNDIDYNFHCKKEFEDSVLKYCAYERKFFSALHITVLFVLLALLVCLFDVCCVIFLIISHIVMRVGYFLGVAVQFCCAVAFIVFMFRFKYIITAFKYIITAAKKILWRCLKKLLPKILLNIFGNGPRKMNLGNGNRKYFPMQKISRGSQEYYLVSHW